MSSASPRLTPFAALPEVAAAAPRRRGRFFGFLLAPFLDVDDRVALKAAAQEAERQARLAAMSAAAAPRRR